MPKVMLVKLSDLATTANEAVVITDAEVNSAVIDDGNSVKQIQGALGLLVRGVTDVGGICCDKSGNTYISDQAQHVIVKVSESGTVNVYAGIMGTSGRNGNKQRVPVSATINGATWTGPSGNTGPALFNTPRGICCDNSGNIYVADTGNNQIRKITPDGYVDCFAGNGDGVAGLVDSSMDATQARFDSPAAVAVDNSGVIYVADTGNSAVRKVWGGKVMNICGGVAGDNTNCRASNVTGVNAILTAPVGICVDAKGNIFVTCRGAGSILPKIKKITPNGWVYLHSGSGTIGRSLGTATTSTVPAEKAYTCEYGAWSYAGICVDRYGYLFVVDNVATARTAPFTATRLLKVDPNGVPAEVADFSGITSPTKVMGVAVSPAQKVFLTITA